MVFDALAGPVRPRFCIIERTPDAKDLMIPVPSPYSSTAALKEAVGRLTRHRTNLSRSGIDEQIEKHAPVRRSRDWRMRSGMLKAHRIARPETNQLYSWGAAHRRMDYLFSNPPRRPSAAVSRIAAIRSQEDLP